jgi:hypothetical protein
MNPQKKTGVEINTFELQIFGPRAREELRQEFRMVALLVRSKGTGSGDTPYKIYENRQ